MNTKAKQSASNKPARETVHAEDLYEETQPFTEPGYVRRNEEQDWDYNPEGDLEITDELAQWFQEQDLVLRWVRHTKEDKLDTKSIAKNKTKGYEFVKYENLPDHLRGRFDTLNVDGFPGCVTQGDLVLMAAPKWKHDRVVQYLEDKAWKNPRAVDKLLQKETGLNSEAFKHINESKSQVVEGGRKPSFAK